MLTHLLRLVFSLLRAEKVTIYIRTRARTRFRGKTELFFFHRTDKEMHRYQSENLCKWIFVLFCGIALMTLLYNEQPVTCDWTDCLVGRWMSNSVTAAGRSPPLLLPSSPIKDLPQVEQQTGSISQPEQEHLYWKINALRRFVSIYSFQQFDSYVKHLFVEFHLVFVGVRIHRQLKGWNVRWKKFRAQCINFNNVLILYLKTQMFYSNAWDYCE